MVYFIRAKYYFNYAKDLFSQLKETYKSLNEEKFIKKTEEIIFIGLKSLWALSKVYAPEKSPSFEEVLAEAFKALEEKDKTFIKSLISSLKSEHNKADLKKEKFLYQLEEFFKILQKELKPIL